MSDGQKHEVAVERFFAGGAYTGMAGQFHSIVQQIRERTDIVGLIGRYVPLKKAGASYKGCCPFHQEKTPSFFVHPDKQFFYCFGCGAKGDAFSFLMDYEGKRFPEVIQDLADQLGLALPATPYTPDLDVEADQKKEKLFQLNHWARQFFIEKLHDSTVGQTARHYIEKRGISAAMLEAFGVGYAPDDWGELTTYLRERGADLELACEIGLVKQAEQSDRIYDRFRHRVMFPIVQPSGRIHGFGGRVLRSEDGAKYINSQESPIFHKSDLLYGLDLAASAIRRKGLVILVEGYLDVICMHQFGFSHTVATLGTAMTEAHLQQLKRFTKHVILLFDGDRAGINAAERALMLLLPEGFSVELLLLPDGHDPDTYLQTHGHDAMTALLEQQLQPAFDFWLQHLRTQSHDDPVQLRDASQKVLELLQTIEDPILRDLYLKRAAERLGVEEVPLRRGLMRVVPRPSATTREATSEAPPTAETPFDTITRSEQQTLSMMIKIVIENPDLFSFISQAELIQRLQHPLLRDIWTQLISDLQEGGDGPSVLETLLESLSPLPSFQQTMAQCLLKDPPFPTQSLQPLWMDLSHKLEQLQLDRKLQHLSRAIRDASKAGDTQQLATLVQEKQACQKQRLAWRELPAHLSHPPPTSSGPRQDAKI